VDRTSRFTVDAADDGRLDTLIARRLDLSRTQAATLIATGCVRVDARAEKASFRPAPGAEVVVELPPVQNPRTVLAEDIPLTIVYEDAELLVIDKPAGMVVHPAPGHWSGTLVNALRGRGQSLAPATGDSRAGLVHRLDKDTSGLIVVARTDHAHRVLAKAITDRRVARRYAALSWGHITGDTLTVDRPIARDAKDRKRMAIALAGRASRTDFYRLARFGSCDLLRAHLHSGRTHQIRVHLASVGHPVVGDVTYGGGGSGPGRRPLPLPPGRQFLHAAWLVFQHPSTGDRMDFRSPLPADLRATLIAASEMPDLIAQPDPLEYLGFYRTGD
jgi:23S rRNA pseudouridine1911/1915/1917 synthase